MKFFETHFIEYVKKVEEYSLHPIAKKAFATFPSDIQSLPSMIMYGPSGVGKYSHALYLISRYSPSHLKYEKRIAIAYNKDTFFIKISDCHFEVDMSLLGCNSKHLWNEIYSQIQDIVSSRSNTTSGIGGGIAPSKKKSAAPLQQHSPTSPGSGPGDVIKETPIRLTSKFRLDTITNIKALKTNMNDLTEPHENICNCIVEIILSPNAQLKYDALRERLYDLLTYDINIQECVWFILRRLITNGSLLPEMMDDIMIQIYTFFQYFNNNYRPIYHLENFVLLLVCKIHGYKHQFPATSHVSIP